MTHHLPSLPRIVTARNGVACEGGCNFLILPGEPIWEGRTCTFCKRWNDQMARRCEAA